MTTWSRWNKVAVGVALTAAACVAAFNTLLDPYSVLGTAEWMRQGFNVNERYRKIEHLRRNPGVYNSFILGSSTMGLYDVQPANDAAEGGRWYNLSFLAGTPPEALRALQFLKKNGQQIDEAMFGIDIFAFRKVEGAREMWKREHPLVRGDSWWNWYSAHVFASSFLIGIDRVVHQLRAQPTMFFDVDGTGRYYLLDWDRQKAEDPKAFADKMIYAPLKKRGSEIDSNALVLIQERFDELRDLKQWADANGVRMHFWINPMHWATLKSIDANSLNEFRAKVREAVGDVADFSLRDDFTKDDGRFYELKHYTPQTAALITMEVLQSARQPGEAKANGEITRSAPATGARQSSLNPDDSGGARSRSAGHPEARETG